MFGKKKRIGDWLGGLLGSGMNSTELLQELEDVLIEGDIGARVAAEVILELERALPVNKTITREELAGRLITLLNTFLEIDVPQISRGRLNLFLVLGVNGVGKTTTLAKLAHFFRNEQGVQKILFSAADTYRAAAVDQLSILGGRLDVPVISQSSGADPGAVIYDSITSATSHGIELLLADTAGRMHTKEHLVRELAKVDGVIKKRIGDGVYHKVLIIDATTGQNALHQAEVFHDAVGVDSVILAKYDSTARGGIALTISKQLQIPFSFIGTGEQISDLVPFESAEYLRSLLGSDTANSGQSY